MTRRRPQPRRRARGGAAGLGRARPARRSRPRRAAGGIAEPVEPISSADDDVDRDDPDAESAALDTESLLSQTLGAQLIEEIKND